MGEPVLPGPQPTPAKRSPVLAPKRRQVSSWWSPRMLTAKCPLSRIDGGQVLDAGVDEADTAGPDGHVDGRVEVEIGVPGQGGGEVRPDRLLAHEPAVGTGRAGFGQLGDERGVVLDVGGIVPEDPVE